MLNNSITYAPNKFSTGSEIVGYYTGTRMVIKTFEVGSVLVIVDGVLYEQASSDSQGYSDIYLGAGNKLVQVVQNTVDGSGFGSKHLDNVYVERSKWTPVTETTVNNRLMTIGDSITQGFNGGDLCWNGFSMLFRRNDSLNTIIGGYAGMTMSLAASSPSRLATTIDWITQAFSNVTGDKKILLALGTNDFKVNSTAASVIGGWLEDLLDEINSADSDIHVFVLSPLNRSDETSLLGDYRTEFGTVCSTRAWTTHIDGNGVLSLANLDDAVHPNATGHLEVYNNIKATITA